MKKSTVSQTITGGSLLLLGMVLLGTLVDVFDSSSVYSFVMPLVLLVSGYGVLDEDKPGQRKTIGFGLMAIGTIALLVRYDVLRGDIVNIVFGTALAGWGLSILVRLYSRKTVDNKLQ